METIIAYIAVATLTISLIIIMILSRIEKKTKEAVEKQEREKHGEQYKKQLRKIVKTNVNKKKIIELIDDLTRRFFQDYYHSKKKIDYSELLETFKRENNLDGEKFSELMLRCYYDPEKITRESITEIEKRLNRLIDIVIETTIYSQRKETLKSNHLQMNKLKFEGKKPTHIPNIRKSSRKKRKKSYYKKQRKTKRHTKHKKK